MVSVVCVVYLNVGAYVCVGMYLYCGPIRDVVALAHFLQPPPPPHAAMPISSVLPPPPTTLPSPPPTALPPSVAQEVKSSTAIRARSGSWSSFAGGVANSAGSGASSAGGVTITAAQVQDMLLYYIGYDPLVWVWCGCGCGCVVVECIFAASKCGANTTEGVGEDEA